MNLKRQITRALMTALPPDEKQRLVDDFVDWLYADLPPADRRQKAGHLAPRLMEWMAESEAGLWLVLFQHFMRLPPVRALYHRARSQPAEVGRATLETGVEPSGR